MAENSTTYNIFGGTNTVLSAGHQLTWRIIGNTGVVSSKSAPEISAEILEVSDHYVARSLNRVNLNFVWPKDIEVNSSGSPVDPFWFSSVKLKLDITQVTGSPKVLIYLGVGNESVPALQWPGPQFSEGYGAFPTSLPLPNIMDVTPIVNGKRNPFEPSSDLSSVQEIALEANIFNTLFSDAKSSLVFSKNINLFILLENELENFETAKTSQTHVFKFHARNTTTGTPPEIVVETIPYHTGFSTLNETRTRMVRDHRRGFPASSAELVNDGYYKGVWVRREDRDPDNGEIKYSNKSREVRTDKRSVR